MYSEKWFKPKIFTDTEATRSGQFVGVTVDRRRKQQSLHIHTIMCKTDSGWAFAAYNTQGAQPGTLCRPSGEGGGEGREAQGEDACGQPWLILAVVQQKPAHVVMKKIF